MSRIAAGSAEGAEQGYRPYLQAALLMGLFTFLFLCAEYLYVDVLSRMVSGDRACWRRMRRWASALLSAGGALLPGAAGAAGAGGVALRGMYPPGLRGNGVPGDVSGGAGVLFAVRPTGRRRLYRRRGPDAHGSVSGPDGGASYALGILLPFISNDLVRSELAEGIVLPVCLLLLGLLMKSRRACSGETEQRQESSGKERTVGLLLVLLVALMTCGFSTLDNAVTLVHSSGETDIGQWPRALLALSGLAAGFVFDWKSRQYMGSIMYCVMMLSTTDR